MLACPPDRQYFSFGPVKQHLPLEIGPATTQMFTLNLRAPAEKAPKGSTRIEFHIVPMDTQGKANPDEFSLHEKSIFFKS